MPEPVRRFVQTTGYLPAGYQAIYDEESQESQSFDEVRAFRHPLSIPVVVLSAGRSPIHDVTTSLQRDLLRLSARSCQIVAASSGHRIPYEAPETVVRAVRVTIDAWKMSSTPTCS